MKTSLTFSFLFLVSCTEARWICSSDAECGKALEYYNLYCRSMFHGRKCTQRCKNSLNILRKQEKAKKLSQCQCKDNEYFEEFQCQNIRQNMENLCEDKVKEEVVEDDLEEDIENETTVRNVISDEINEIDVDQSIPKIKSLGQRIQTSAVIILISMLLNIM